MLGEGSQTAPFHTVNLARFPAAVISLDIASCLKCKLMS